MSLRVGEEDTLCGRRSLCATTCKIVSQSIASLRLGEQEAVSDLTSPVIFVARHTAFSGSRTDVPRAIVCGSSDLGSGELRKSKCEGIDQTP